MKLGIVNTVMEWGGAERWTLDTALALKRRGHDVLLMGGENSPLVQRAQASELSVRTIPEGFGLRQFRRIVQLRQSRMDEEIEVWLANSLADLWLVNRMRRFGRRLPLVWRRSLDSPLGNHWIHQNRLRNVKLFLTNSLATRRTLRSSLPWVTEEKTRVLYNPIHVDSYEAYSTFPVREMLQIPSDAFVIGLIGRFVPQKGFVEFLASAPELLGRRKDAHLLFVGDGPLRSRLESISMKLGIDARCRFSGSTNCVQAYYEACDVIVIPSGFEGFCYVAAEAQLMQRPVVAFRTSSLPEVVLDGRTGFLVDIDDRMMMIERILELAGSPDLRRKLGQCGLQHVRRICDPEPIYDELEIMLHTVIEEDPKTPRRLPQG